MDLFTRAGFEVHAISGKADQADFLRSLGATEVLGRDALATRRPMESARFGGGLDNVGGAMLASLLAQTAPYGNVATAGLAASPELATTVMPFILRGVNLLGIDSVMCPVERRQRAWDRLAAELPADMLESMTEVIPLDALPEYGGRILAGQTRGRVVVEMG